MSKQTARPAPASKRGARAAGPHAAARPARGARTGLIVAVVAAVVVIAGLVAIVATRDSSGDAAPPAATDPAASAPSAPVGEPIVYGTIEITGDPVPETPEGGQPPIGAAVPTITGTDYAGNPITIEPGTGPMMIVVLAHWCPHCNAEIPRIIEWSEAGGVPEGLQIVGISTAVTDTRPNFPPSQWLVDKGWQWPAIADNETSEAARSVGTSGFPTVVVVGADGTVKDLWSGESDVETIDARVDAALGL